MTPDPLAEQATKAGNTTKLTLAEIPPPNVGRPRDATATLENDILNSSKQFYAAEKLRMSERQREIARQTKAVNLGDLRKFAASFTLPTPIPMDLIPILTKDETKQREIVEKQLAFADAQQASAKQTKGVKSMPLNPTSASFVPSTSRKKDALASTPSGDVKMMQTDASEVKGGFEKVRESLAALRMDVNRMSASVHGDDKMLNDGKVEDSDALDPPRD